MKMLVRLMALVLGGVCAGAPGQSGKRPMTFADLQAMKRVSDPQISPSGKWVLFSVTDVSLEKNSKTDHLWVVPLGDRGGKPMSESPDPSAGSGQAMGHPNEVQLTHGSGESNGRFSPDGKWVMYSSAEGGSSQIWVASWNDGSGKMGSGHAVTALETEADGGVWAPDSKHFLFVSSVYPECESHAAMGPQRNEEEAACNARKDADAAKNPVKAMVFDHLLYRHWNAFVGAKHSHIFYAGVDKGAPMDLTPASVVGDHEAPTFSLGGPTGYAISPDGREVAYVTNLDKVPAASTNNDIFVLQVGAEPSTARKVSTSPGSDDGPAYSPDGKWLAWRSQARNGFESDKFDLVAMDRSSGSTRNLTLHFDSWVDEFVWAPDSKDLYLASPIEGKELIFELATSGGKIEEVASTHVGEFTFTCSQDFIGCEQAEFGGIQVAPDGKRFVTTRMSVNGPTEIVAMTKVEVDPVSWYKGACTGCWGIVTRDDGRKPWDVAIDIGPVLVDVAPLSRMNDSLLRTLDLSLMEHFWFTGAANTKVEGFIVRPPNFDPAKKYPVKFLMHGGPQTAWGDAWSYRWNWELMAASGYVVVGINRRGSTGYGQKFVDEVSGDWGGKAFVDLMKGLDYAEAHYSFIDKDRECALGASYGGFMANWVLTHTDRFKCIVTHDGMYNPQSAYGSTEEMWFNEWEFRPTVAAARTNGNRDGAKDATVRSEKQSDGMVEQTKPAQPWDYFGETNENDPFRKWSPMLHIKAAHTPTLIIHSQRDYRLDVSEGFQMFTALQRLGVPSRMLYFPDEGHWVLKPQNSQLWYETVDDWCDRWLGMGKYKDVGPEANPMAAVARKSAK